MAQGAATAVMSNPLLSSEAAAAALDEIELESIPPRDAEPALQTTLPHTVVYAPPPTDPKVTGDAAPLLTVPPKRPVPVSMRDFDALFTPEMMPSPQADADQPLHQQPQALLVPPVPAPVPRSRSLNAAIEQSPDVADAAEDHPHAQLRLSRAALANVAAPAPFSPLQPGHYCVDGPADAFPVSWTPARMRHGFAAALAVCVIAGVAGAVVWFPLSCAMFALCAIIGLVQLGIEKMVSGVVIVHRDPELAGAVDFVRFPALRRLLGDARTTTRFDVANVELVLSVDLPAAVTEADDVPLRCPATFELRDPRQPEDAVAFTGLQKVVSTRVASLNAAFAGYFRSVAAAVAAVRIAESLLQPSGCA